MDTQHHHSLPIIGSLFGNYQFGDRSPIQFPRAVPESAYTVLPTNRQATGPPASPPVHELAAFSLENPSRRFQCAMCRGDHYDFTKYFHNKKFFSVPPHELLGKVERSYILKNRLSSILVTYITHNLHDDHMMVDIEKAIDDWVNLVAALVAEVTESMIDTEGVADALAGVEGWTKEFAGQLREHLGKLTRQKMEVPAGWMKEMLSYFRKRWECVWICCANACAYPQDVAMEGSCSSVLEAEKGASEGALSDA